MICLTSQQLTSCAALTEDCNASDRIRYTENTVGSDSTTLLLTRTPAPSFSKLNHRANLTLFTPAQSSHPRASLRVPARPRASPHAHAHQARAFRPLALHWNFHPSVTRLACHIASIAARMSIKR